MFMSCHGHKTLASIGLVLLLKLIDDLKPYVLLKRTDSSEAIKQLLDGFTNENAMDSQEHCQDIHDLIMEICRKNLKGRLGEYPMTTLLPIEKVMEDESEEGKSVERFIALYFNVNLSSLKQIEKQEKVLAVGLKIIVCYVMGEIVELASNYTRDCSCFSVGQPAIENAIKYDSELLESLPSSICSISNVLSVLVNNLFNQHTDSSQVSIREGPFFSSISPDVHSNILKFVGNVDDLLKMRTVCKYWNSLIVENDDIWKYCYHLTKIEDPLFLTFGTSRTLSDIRNFDSKGWKNKFFSDIYPYISSRDSLVESKMRTDSCDNSFREILKQSVSLSVNFYREIFIFNSSIPTDGRRTKIGGNPNMIDKSKLWKKRYAFIGQIDFSEISSFIDCQLPKSGYLYFFAKIDSFQINASVPNIDSYDGYVIYQDYQDNSTVPLVTGIEIDELTITKFANSSLKLGLSLDTRVFADSKKEFEDYEYFNHTSNCPSYIGTICGQYTATFRNDLQTDKDDIILLSTNANYPGMPFDAQFVYTINRESLLKADFSAAKLFITVPKTRRF
ncbi:hypothetical protein NAEGRDRAFT_71080 [Naegleria gruberi]|uniref:F-box domain-containing protein n=1 Tax=Naegleria gruberi TaxID=5762 RepID=D2VQA4_NAEGR|nr:uncharacterized protein NAEGRDRAFT_71080 [Naegleria gruberi]EFC41075.1 hypothetical protein NAEGRDRAFT_71080 [Naegleria gruberi]|eukprot:XP_002673819.1 hypothetical protein NAEGRDRAFT_71080 [Naegleria gruberi strain NEG-M]